MPPKKKQVVKVQLTFTKKQMEIIRKYKDIFGESDAEIVRSIVTNWLIKRQPHKGGEMPNSIELITI